MLTKKYKYELSVAPVKITWTEELVEDSDAGDFYVRLSPHVDYAEEYIHKGDAWHSGGPRGTQTRTRADKIKTNAALGVLGAMKRNEIAQQNRRIFADVMKSIESDAQKKINANTNKMRGQRWNKKV